MQIEFQPLLETQRSLLDHPRGFERFRKYLATMIGADGELALPLMAFNPMAKSHVAALLDNLIEVCAETAAREAAATGATRLAAEAGVYKLASSLRTTRTAAGPIVISQRRPTTFSRMARTISASSRSYSGPAASSILISFDTRR